MLFIKLSLVNLPFIEIIICSNFFSRPVVGMLFGAVAWYCSLVPYQTFSQQEAYEALSRYVDYFSCTTGSHAKPCIMQA